MKWKLHWEKTSSYTDDPNSALVHCTISPLYVSARRDIHFLRQSTSVHLQSTQHCEAMICTVASSQLSQMWMVFSLIKILHRQIQKSFLIISSSAAPWAERRMLAPPPGLLLPAWLWDGPAVIILLVWLNPVPFTPSHIVKPLLWPLAGANKSQQPENNYSTNGCCYAGNHQWGRASVHHRAASDWFMNRNDQVRGCSDAEWNWNMQLAEKLCDLSCCVMLWCLCVANWNHARLMTHTVHTIQFLAMPSSPGLGNKVLFIHIWTKWQSISSHLCCSIHQSEQFLL